MACCAFALFVVSQIVAGVVALRCRLPFRLFGPPDAGPAINPASTWQLHGAMPEAPAAALPRRRGWLNTGPALAVVFALEIALVGAGAMWGLSRPPSKLAPEAEPTWCLSPTSILHTATLGDREPAIAALWSLGDNP